MVLQKMVILYSHSKNYKSFVYVLQIVLHPKQFHASFLLNNFEYVLLTMWWFYRIFIQHLLSHMFNKSIPHFIVNLWTFYDHMSLTIGAQMGGPICHKILKSYLFKIMNRFWKLQLVYIDFFHIFFNVTNVSSNFLISLTM